MRIDRHPADRVCCGFLQLGSTIGKLTVLDPENPVGDIVDAIVVGDYDDGLAMLLGEHFQVCVS